mmetsp:Transcript_20234/g.58523  ORF Transcript_20234/g.58523 Transcript_20234/m.58523 type:complete len:509 (-) Transcript_20234:70-1596(-)
MRLLRLRFCHARWVCRSFNFPAATKTTSCQPYSVTAFREDDASKSQGYISIGSFNSDNVEVMNSIPTSVYSKPLLPFDAEATSSDVVCSQGDWMLDKRWTFLNHGAFGAALRCGYNRAAQWREYLERQPLRYFDRDLLPHLVESNRQMAAFVKGQSTHMVLVQNATTALNTIIGGYAQTYGNDSLVLYFDTSYGSVKKMAKHYCGSERVVEIPFQEVHLPLSSKNDDSPEATFLDAFDRALAHLKRDYPPSRLTNALLILDQTTSNTAINMPVKALAKRAKEEGMLVLVDGAHGLLAQNIDMEKLTSAGVDFYVSNGHKWLSAPRGSAMLYCCDEGLRHTVLRRPAIISHGIDDGFISRFLWDGCRDYASELALPAVLSYWRDRGENKTRTEMRSNLTNAVKTLASCWHCEVKDEADLVEAGVTIVPVSLLSPMALVLLPKPICGNTYTDRKTSADAKEIQDFLFHNMIEVPIKCVNGVLYVRVSSHIYNTTEEYEHLGRVILSYPVF